MVGHLRFPCTAISWLGSNCFCLHIITHLGKSYSISLTSGLALNTASGLCLSILQSKSPLQEEEERDPAPVGLFCSLKHSQVTYGHLSWVETQGEEIGKKSKVEMWSFEDGCGTQRKGQVTQATISS